MSSLHIAVLPGDGIGIEVVDEALALLRHLAGIDNTLSLDFEMIEGGAGLASAHRRPRRETAMQDTSIR
jgi:isocitrate/isopropylmalate dehydrogenase